MHGCELVLVKICVSNYCSFWFHLMACSTVVVSDDKTIHNYFAVLLLPNYFIYFLMIYQGIKTATSNIIFTKLYYFAVFVLTFTEKIKIKKWPQPMLFSFSFIFSHSRHFALSVPVTAWLMNPCETVW